MELAVTIFLFIVGLALIIKGGDVFVDAATWAADISGIPKFTTNFRHGHTIKT